MHPLSGHIRSRRALATGDLIDLVQKHDPRLFHLVDRFTRGVIHVDQLLGFLLRQVLQRFRYLHEPLLFLTLEHPTQHVAEIVLEVIQPAHIGDDADRHSPLLNFHFHGSFIHLAFSQLETEFRPGCFVGVRRGLGSCLRCAVYKSRPRWGRRQEEVEQTIFGLLFSLLLDERQTLGLDHIDRELGEVTNDRFHIAPDIAHFGKFRRFDLDERRLGQLGQPSGDFRFAHAGWPDHDNVLRHDLIAKVWRQLLATPAIAKGDSHHALRILLPDDIAVQFFNDLRGSEAIEIQSDGLSGERLHHCGLSSKFFNKNLLVCVDVNGPCDGQGFSDDHRGFQL